MGLPILIIGRSGTGKSTSLRNMDNVLLINVNNKTLPFADTSKITGVAQDDILEIKKYLRAAKEKGFKTIVIDDAGYLMVKKFMAGHRASKGSNQFDLYNEIADNFYNLIQCVIHDLDKDVHVYIIMHEEKNDFGETKPKTIGKLLDDKVCIEGLFTIVLRALKHENHYVFSTVTDGLDVTKTPMNMFKEQYIDNDLAVVDKTIRDYYNEPNAKPKPTEAAK